MGWLRRLRNTIFDSELDDEFRAEARAYFDELVRQGVCNGATQEHAELEARRGMGNLALARDETRDADALRWLDDLVRDIQHALRQLRRSPGFAAVAIMTLGLGIGAATAIYSVIRNVVLAPFPYRDADRMVFARIYDLQQGPEIGRQGYSAPEAIALIEGSDVFEATTAALGERVLYRHQSGTQSLRAANVTAGTFEFFGMRPLRGRVLQPADYESGAPPVFVMRHKTWMEQFGGDPEILNTTFVLNGTPRTLVGIMPARFGWYGADLFFPAALARRETRTRESWFVLGRLKPHVSDQQAQAQLTVIAQRLAKTYPAMYPQRLGVHVGKLGESVIGAIRPTLYTVLAAVVLLLLIACGNVANLMLARATTREKEFGLRIALGAGRTRIIRLLLVESLVLATTGAATGVFFAWGGLKALVAALPSSVVPSEAVIELSTPVLAVTLAIAASTALICGLAPALQSCRSDLSDPLRDSGKGTSGGFRGRRMREALVVLEVALSLSLLIGAGLLMRSFVALRTVALGFHPDHVFTAVLQLPADRYATAEQVTAFLRPLLARVKAIPGVSYASVSTAGVLDGGAESTLEIAGKTQSGAPPTLFQQVTADHFSVLRLEFREGGPFSEADITDARKVAVVNETFVRTHLPGDHPIGQRVRLDRLETDAEPVHGAWFEIVGVVADVRNRGLRAPIEAEMWIPSTIARSVVHVLSVRTSQDPAMLTNAVRREVSVTDSSVPMIGPGRLEDLADRMMYAGPRFGFLVMMVFACIGLILTTVGVYSVLAYSTAQRTREIGIRMALGAGHAHVVGTVVSNGLRPVAVGIAIGLVVSALFGRALATQLVGGTAHDPRTLAAAAMLLATIAAFACWIPARRAARVDPLAALRRE